MTAALIEKIKPMEPKSPVGKVMKRRGRSAGEEPRKKKVAQAVDAVDVIPYLGTKQNKPYRYKGSVIYTSVQACQWRVKHDGENKDKAFLMEDRSQNGMGPIRGVLHHQEQSIASPSVETSFC